MLYMTPLRSGVLGLNMGVSPAAFIYLICIYMYTEVPPSRPIASLGGKEFDAIGMNDMLVLQQSNSGARNNAA